MERDHPTTTPATKGILSSCSQGRHCQSEATRLSLGLHSVSLLFTSTSCYNLENLIRETSVSYVLLPLLHTPFGCLVASFRRLPCSMTIKQVSYHPMGVESYLTPSFPAFSGSALPCTGIDPKLSDPNLIAFDGQR